MLVNNIAQPGIRELLEGAGEGGGARNLTDTIVATKATKGAVGPKKLDSRFCRREIISGFRYKGAGHFSAVQLGTACPRTRTALNVLLNLDYVPNYN